MKTNAIRAIHPYRCNELWVFDDPATGLIREPFVCGIDDMLDIITREIPDAKKGFTCLFSDSRFPQASIELQWRREDEHLVGNYYYCPELDMEGWLCPALLRYFEKAPARIYAAFLPAGVKKQQPNTKKV